MTNMLLTLISEFSERLPFVRSSVIIAIIMLLKTHLKTLYGISEECVDFTVVFLCC